MSPAHNRELIIDNFRQRRLKVVMFFTTQYICKLTLATVLPQRNYLKHTITQYNQSIIVIEALLGL